MASTQNTCHRCGHPFNRGAAFCSGCGRQLNKRAGASRERAREPDGQLRERSLAARDKVRETIRVRARRRNRVVYAVRGLIVLAAVGGSSLGEPGIWFPAIALLILTQFFYRSPDRWFTEAEYYSLEGARTAAGKHRCIYCGAPGIYRQGEYRTSNTYASCSKCEKPLFAK